MGTAERLDAGLGHAEMLDLAFGDQVADGAGDILDRHVGVDAMLVSRSMASIPSRFSDPSTALRMGSGWLSARLSRLGIDWKAELGRDSGLVANVAQSLADNSSLVKGP